MNGGCVVLFHFMVLWQPAGKREDYQMPFLNSGVFLGSAEAMRRAHHLYTSYPNADSRNDQDIWQNIAVDYTLRGSGHINAPPPPPSLSDGVALHHIALIDTSGRLAFSLHPVPRIRRLSDATRCRVEEVEGGGAGQEEVVVYAYDVAAPFDAVQRRFNFDAQFDVLRYDPARAALVARIDERLQYIPCAVHYNGRSKGAALVTPSQPFPPSFNSVVVSFVVTRESQLRM
jgi:hypothetical protein